MTLDGLRRALAGRPWGRLDVAALAPAYADSPGRLSEAAVLVPVFVRGSAAWAEGVGERLTPLDLPEPVYLLVQPDATVSTAEVFKAPELTRDSPAIKIADFLMAGGRNDCEPVVRRRFPAVAEAFDWLGRHAPVRLTGTGACVFAAMPDEASARALLAEVPRRWRGYVVRGRNCSPLVARLRRERERQGASR